MFHIAPEKLPLLVVPKILVGWSIRPLLGGPREQPNYFQVVRDEMRGRGEEAKDPVGVTKARRLRLIRSVIRSRKSGAPTGLPMRGEGRTIRKKVDDGVVRTQVAPRTKRTVLLRFDAGQVGRTQWRMLHAELTDGDLLETGKLPPSQGSHQRSRGGGVQREGRTDRQRAPA